MSKSNIVLNNVVLINNGRAADFLKWIHPIIFRNDWIFLYVCNLFALIIITFAHIIYYF